MADRVEWRGDAVLRLVRERAVAPALTEIGLRVERRAKPRLQKSEQLTKSGRLKYKRPGQRGKVRPAAAQWVVGGGRGLRTGTLRRSIHCATPGYNWEADDVTPSNQAPERGGQAAHPAEQGAQLTVQVGSGLRYARTVHDKHYNPTVNGFLTKAADEVRSDVPGVLRRHAAAAGLTE